MRLIGVNNLADSLFVTMVSSHIGAWLDRHQHERRRAALTLIYANGFGVATLFILLAGLLTVKPTLISDTSSTSLHNTVLWIALLAVAVALNATLRCVVSWELSCQYLCMVK